ncbi:LuxR family two component transcriptional regulator [Hydrogenispora ethanolica]|uniref:LuxR family two component transcriptional regulator n=1 Tax=Hydrogenispora ethanolica TaxID=1082276 RepID=A0A4R1RVP2_HYDET|nr:response regulator transcription factor [Hydrogenispora ethanolica]TCL70733.1 LuxR family two component transcriptional regulator [Hydrogenispora ethanolica]
MKVLLVDDHALFLEGLKNLLVANDFEVIGTARSSLDALSKVELLRPDLILMDIQMPGCNGIETTRMIKEKYPEIKIVMLTVFQDDANLFEAIRAGASGYLLKGMEKEKFLELLAGIADGESPLSPGLAARVLAEFARRENERVRDEAVSQEMTTVLTPRQIAILQGVAQGLTYKEVADAMGLSEAAIKYHMGEITGRLQLKNRSQAVAYAMEMGLLKEGKSGKER